jgi:TonB family protein
VDALADAARILSGADGTALGLETKGIILCRARSGNIAPPIGAPISAESGISGECLRTVTMLVCHDAMTDPRVDTEVCRSLGIRSVAAVPVRGPNRVAGILEAFSARANAFDGDALTALRDLAEIAEMAYRREVPHYAPARTIPEIPWPSPAARSTLVAAREEILGGISQPSKRRVWMAVAIAAVLLLVVGVAWWAWHTPADEASSSSNSSGTTQNVRAATPEPSPSAPALELIPKPAPGMSSGRSEKSRAPSIVQPAAGRESIDLRSVNASGISGTPDTIEVRAPKGKAAESPSAPDPPPSVNLSASANPEALARLSSVPAQMPVAPRISQGVVEATLNHRVEPIYPTQARNQRIQGKVTLSATISADGSVRQVAIVNGSPVLAEAARTAVRQWRYNPAKLNGTPIEVQKEIIVLFAQPY